MIGRILEFSESVYVSPIFRALHLHHLLPFCNIRHLCLILPRFFLIFLQYKGMDPPGQIFFLHLVTKNIILIKKIDPFDFLEHDVARICAFLESAFLYHVVRPKIFQSPRVPVVVFEVRFCSDSRVTTYIGNTTQYGGLTDTSHSSNVSMHQRYHNFVRPRRIV